MPESPAVRPLTPADAAHLRSLLREGVGPVYPGAVLLAAQNGKIRFHEAAGMADPAAGVPASVNTVFDLASLTKPLATALVLMILRDRRKLRLCDEIGALSPLLAQTDKADLTVEDLLAHRSGLPPWKPLYRGLHERAAEAGSRRKALTETALSVRRVRPPGKRTVYSDIGFILLRILIEDMTGRRLDTLARDWIYDPMELALWFNSPCSVRPGEYAVTGICPCCKTPFRGVVHDDNARAAHGVDGHAGLFGTSTAVFRLVEALRRAAAGEISALPVSRNTARRFLTPSGDGFRTPGFDRPSGENSAAGRRFSADSVGHLGFTGVSFWMDMARSVIILLFTNRVYPEQRNTRIRVFRPQIHDAVMAALARDFPAE